MEVWVQNRVETIRENVVIENWDFVPTSLNAADICTRKYSVGKLKICLLWWNGPEFLLGGKDMWPSQEILLPKNVDLEEKEAGRLVLVLTLILAEVKLVLGKWLIVVGLVR